METGGAWNDDDRRRWLIPALVGAGVLLLALILVGVLIARARGNSATPTVTRVAGSPTRPPLIGSPTTGGGAGGTVAATRPASGAPTPGTGTGAVATVAPGAGAATAPPASGAKVFTVSGTGGDGVVLRAAPGGDQLSVLPEGTRIEQIGADREVNGVNWRNVRAPDGAEGWVAAQYTAEVR